MSSKEFGHKEGNVWKRELDTHKHVFWKYKAYGFHPSFNVTMQEVEGVEIVETDTGAVRYITREAWYENATFITSPKPQYIVPRAKFKMVKPPLKNKK